MEDPKAKFQPDTYKGEFWYKGDNRPRFAHQNNGVLNYWFYLLTEGGFGQNDNGFNYDIEGIGIEKSAKITFDAMAFYLTALSDFFDFKEATIQTTINNFGENSIEVEAVRNCWKAVGVTETITSLDNNPHETLTVSLNQEYLSIKTNEYFISHQDVKLHDLSGKEVTIDMKSIDDFEHQIPVNTMLSGVYILRIRENQTTTIKKILIKHF